MTPAVPAALAALLLAGPAAAACSLPPPPAATLAPGPAPDGIRLPMEVSTLVFHLDGTAIYPVKGSDGMTHVAFAATVSNVSAFPTTITAVEVVDAATGAAVGPIRIASMGGIDVALKPFLFTSRDPTDDKSFSATLPAGAGGSLFPDVVLPAGAALPAYVALRITASVAIGGADKIFAATGQPMPVACEPPIRLVPPLKGPGWVNGNGCCGIVTPHRWALQPIFGRQQPPEQFAIDFVRVGADGKLYDGDIARLASWPYFGAEVVAAGAGTVVEVVDGMAEGTPGASPPGVTAESAAGNHVIVDMGESRFAMYAHLQPGSLAVKVGDAVAAGQRLGLLGNTGNSDGPHLHFQVMDRPSPLDATGLPFVFERMTYAGRLEGTGNAAIDGVMAGKPAILIRDSAGERQDAMPLTLDVLDFP
jgi:hypothetical protein